ncbi:hypothetical protein FUAX_09550 [Fulvitalea axinellae]|uniref:Uncharacterized protein n=1 Tax=Fulvitalea axinellae TaxID=1182444 RepID=A0AAU9CKJ4_9BACT|nr:hypothetical protein FUAX_09550 [Fulvitalea axinellae]
MEFDPTRDQIALTIPKFRLRHGADLGRNEVYIVSVAIDESGLANPQTALSFGVSTVIPNLKKWSWHHFGGDGFMFYGPKKPGSFVSYALYYMESDQTGRDVGAQLKTLIGNQEVKDAVSGIGSIAQMAGVAASKANLVTATLVNVAKVVAKLMADDQDDYLHLSHGTLFRDQIDGSEPYHAGEEFRNPPAYHIEDIISVRALIQEGGERGQAVVTTLEEVEVPAG